METKANYVLVGIFTLVAIVRRVRLRLLDGDGRRPRRDGAAAGSHSRLGVGLERGSAVLFNGVRVGDVERVYIDVNDPTIAIADTEVDRLTPITRSTKADIGIAGLTGQANIELKRRQPRRRAEAARRGRGAQARSPRSRPTLRPSPTCCETAQDIFTRADKVLTNLEGFITDVRGPLTQTIKNAEKFSQALADNADGVDDFLASVTKLSTQLAGASDKLEFGRWMRPKG